MHETRPTGVRFVLTNPADPGRPDDFSDWYDTYAAALTVPGYLADAFRFENPDASPGPDSPRYATIYDIVTSDPATAWPDTEHSPDYPTHLFSDPRAKLVAPVLRASYAFVGSQARPGEHGRLTGIQAHRHPCRLVQRRRRHRASASGSRGSADRPVLLRLTIPAHRRLSRARRMARGIRDRCPRPPRHVRAGDQLHAVRCFRAPTGTEPVVPPGSCPRSKHEIG